MTNPTFVEFCQLMYANFTGAGGGIDPVDAGRSESDGTKDSNAGISGDEVEY